MKSLIYSFLSFHLLKEEKEALLDEKKRVLSALEKEKENLIEKEKVLLNLQKENEQIILKKKELSNNNNSEKEITRALTEYLNKMIFIIFQLLHYF